MQAPRHAWTYEDVVHALQEHGPERATNLLPQVGLVQIRGSVYLNCCSMPRTTVLHWMQRKAPRNSSGRTSLVRVTVPWKQVRWPTFSTLQALTSQSQSQRLHGHVAGAWGRAAGMVSEGGGGVQDASRQWVAGKWWYG